MNRARAQQDRRPPSGNQGLWKPLVACTNRRALGASSGITGYRVMSYAAADAPRPLRSAEHEVSAIDAQRQPPSAAPTSKRLTRAARQARSASSGLTDYGAMSYAAADAPRPQRSAEHEVSAIDAPSQCSQPRSMGVLFAPFLPALAGGRWVHRQDEPDIL